MATRYQFEIQGCIKRLQQKARSTGYDALSKRDYDTFYRLTRNYYRMFGMDLYIHQKGTIDYVSKSVIFDHYAYDLKCVKKARYWTYLYEIGEAEKFADSLDPKDKLRWQCYLIRAREIERFQPALYDEMIRICNADRQRRLRLKKRIATILDKGNAYFLTLTFSDDALASTQPHIRRKYVRELVKAISDDYVGNIDFGKKNGREHYHVVLHTDKFNDLVYKYFKGSGYSADYSAAIDSWSNYGKYFIKQCGNDESDSTALAKYTCKLTNHAIKETTKRNALIYSR